MSFLAIDVDASTAAFILLDLARAICPSSSRNLLVVRVVADEGLVCGSSSRAGCEPWRGTPRLLLSSSNANHEALSQYETGPYFIDPGGMKG